MLWPRGLEHYILVLFLSHWVVGSNPSHDMTLVSLSKMFYYKCFSSLRGKHGYLQGERLILCLEKPSERHGSSACTGHGAEKGYINVIGPMHRAVMLSAWILYCNRAYTINLNKIKFS